MESSQVRIRRPGFTLVELLVVITVIGVLIGLLLPAVQSTRESSRRSTCANNIRQLALACHVYADSAGGFLPNSMRPSTVRLSWMTRILPFIEESALFDKYDRNANWSSNMPGEGHTTANAVLVGTRLAVAECPSCPASSGNRYDADPQPSTQPFAYPIANVRAGLSADGNTLVSPGLFAAPTDYSPVVYVDAALANLGAIPNENLATVAATLPPTAAGNTTRSPGDGMLPKSYGGGERPRFGQVSDGVMNTIMLAESAGRPFVYRAGRLADDGADVFPTRRVNGGGWARPASDISLDGTSGGGATFRSAPTEAINATNGESVETAPFETGYYGIDGGSEIYAFHSAGANVAFGDASVRLVGEDVSLRVLAALVTRAGAEGVGNVAE